MLDALRRGSTGWIAKLLFALLVLSFAVWGVADVFTGWGRGAIAKVGDQEIRVEDYQRAFQNEINQISQQAGRRITTEQAHAAGLDNRVLAQLIGWSAVEAHANELGLALSDESLAEAMKTDPAFKGPDGKFNRLAFENVLDRLGISERGFLQLRRRDELRGQLTSALINGVAVPDSMIELVNNWRDETRIAEHFTIDADKAVTVPEPDEAKIKATYESNKQTFMAPEFRKIGLLVLSVDELKKSMNVTDAEAQAAYDDSQKRLQHARAPARAADRLQGQGGRRGRQEGHRRRQVVRRRRQGSRRQGFRHRPRPHLQGPPDRPEDRRRRLQPGQGHRLRSGRGPLRHRAAARLRHPAGRQSHLRRRQGPGEGQGRGHEGRRRSCRRSSTTSRISARPASR